MMRSTGELRLADHTVSIVMLEEFEIRSIPLDQRVLRVSTHIREGRIVLTQIDLRSFLNEEDTDSRSHLRKMIIESMAKAYGPEGDAMTFAGAQVLADSIEDVTIIELDKVPPILASFTLKAPCIMFVPNVWMNDLNSLGGISSSSTTTSVPWKANTIDVWELASRFDEELGQWQMYDFSRFASGQNKARDALAKQLGMDETFSRMEDEYWFGRKIGEAVGKEHSNQLLAMDLKTEHFIPSGRDHVWHVDHANDVFLLREATSDECAKSIAPLYQQMSYPLWHAFREGYWYVRRQKALEILMIFDGSALGEILSAHALSYSREARNRGDADEALSWCDDAEKAIIASCEGGRAAAGYQVHRLNLIRGDILLQNGAYERALQIYDATIRDLENSVDFTYRQSMIASALVNSGGALAYLDRVREARNRFENARVSAEKLPPDDPMRKSLIEACDHSLQGLLKPAGKNPKRGASRRP